MALVALVVSGVPMHLVAVGSLLLVDIVSVEELLMKTLYFVFTLGQWTDQINSE